MKYFDELLKDHDSFVINSSSDIRQISVQYGDCFIEIRFNSSEIADCLNLLYGPMVVDNDSSGKFNGAIIKYFVLKQNSAYIIARNGKFAYSLDDLITLAPWFDWMLMNDLVDHNQHLTAIHAGAMVRDGRTVIISGESGGGKSTMTMMMCLAGWRFVTDEVTVFSNNGVSGIPRAFCLAKYLACKLFGELDRFQEGIKRDKNYMYINPGQVNIVTNEKQEPITHIIFTEKSEDRNEIEQLSLSMAMYLLTDSLFNINCDFKNKLDALVDSVEKASIGKLYWNDADAAIRAIQGFIYQQ